MTQLNVCNCTICAREFNLDELQSLALSSVNDTRFKICQSCLDQCDPAEDYQQVREIISSYLWFAEKRAILKDALSEVKSIKKL